MSTNQILTSAITKQLTAGVSKKLDIPQSTAKDAVDIAVPLLIGGLAKNTTDPKEAKSLSKAISEDHDGSILENLSSALLDESVEKDGEKIVGHVLGNRTRTATQVIGKQKKLDSKQVLQILSIVAPVIMGMLGKKKISDSLDASDISDILQKAAGMKSRSSSKKSDILTKVLDQDNDGSYLDDAADLGIKVIGNMLKKK